MIKITKGDVIKIIGGLSSIGIIGWGATVILKEVPELGLASGLLFIPMAYIVIREV